MTKIVKGIIKRFFNVCGFDMKRIPKWEKDRYFWLKQMNINTVFDIGANEGQFVQEIHRVLPNAAIYAFEPLKSCFEHLKNKENKVRKLQAFMFALGEFNGETYMYRNKFLPSSSVLEMADLHKEIFPFSKNIAREKIIVKRLDDVRRDFNLHITNNILIKIDVQGYEDKVIFGGKDTFSNASVIITEVSFVELYREQILFDDIYTLLKDLGFIYTGNLSQLVNPHNGRPIQADSVFLNKKILNF